MKKLFTHELEKYINKDKTIRCFNWILPFVVIIIKNYLIELIKFYMINIKIIY